MNKNLINRLTKWVEFEQTLRFRAGKEHIQGSKELGVFNYFVYIIDAINNIRIKEIIVKHEYPTQKLLGKTGMKKFWLLIQHQDEDLELQKNCLEKCDFAPLEKAYLTDRVLLAEGKKQRYGTQYKREANGYVCKPLEDPKNINKLRKSVGLGTLEKYMRLSNKRFRTVK